MKKKQKCIGILLRSFWGAKLLTILMIVTIAGVIISSLLPPLLLEKVVDGLSMGERTSMGMAFVYLGLLACNGILLALREWILTVLGQRMTKQLRQALCQKLERLPAETLVEQEPGAVVSHFVGDVDTIETLFSSGIISMISNVFQVIGIFIMIFLKNPGLGVSLLLILPFLFWFTRTTQKKMLQAQIENRVAVSKVSNHVPETILNIRTIHLLHKENYMRKRYDGAIDESFHAMEKTNFYDAMYSPVILVINAVVVALVLCLSASGIPVIQSFFGMSVGTAVAVINYIAQVFGPIEEIGMEIQTIQSAIAGVRRIEEFLQQEERWEVDTEREFIKGSAPVLVKNVSFAYEEGQNVLDHLDFSLQKGEHLTIVGRTGAGKSTLFKLLLGLYRPKEGEILIHGQSAERIPDDEKRRIFGYVEQRFRLIPGTIADQITLLDPGISREDVIWAAKLVGLDETIMELSKGYDTLCEEKLFSRGQWQLLSIARAVAGRPEILLLDEITANLDADTEQKVLKALQDASKERTVISISHRFYEQNGGLVMQL